MIYLKFDGIELLELIMSSTDRSRVHRARMKEKGFKEARSLWVRPEHEKLIKQAAKRLREVDVGTEVVVDIKTL